MARPSFPPSAAWRPGDPPGRRRFATVFTEEPLLLEAGGMLRDVQVAYETWGVLDDDRANAVLVCHALTGDSHAAGPVEAGHPQPGWWDGLIGPGKGIDTDRWFVVCPNLLGGCQGTTGPASLAPDGRPYGSRFPAITVRDQVAVEAALADALGLDVWAAVAGGSMGGMRVLEWALTYPSRVASGIALATGAAATADQIATQSTQVHAIRADPGYRGGNYYDAPDGRGPHGGLGLARRIGHLTYRTEREVEERFGRLAQAGERPLHGGRYQIESYLDHHAAKLARRFDANSYVVLTEAMNHHDIGRGRGGVGAALRRITTPLTVIGIDSDRLYPLHLQERIAAVAPGAQGLEVISSPYGHDGFLIEAPALAPLFQRALCGSPCPSP